MQSLANEKEVLGFYLSDHPLKGFENFSKVWSTAPVADLPAYFLKVSEGKPVEKPKWGEPRNKIRVVISFDENLLLVVTIIRLN